MRKQTYKHYVFQQCGFEFINFGNVDEKVISI